MRLPRLTRAKRFRWWAGLTLVLVTGVGAGLWLWGDQAADAQVMRDEVGDYVQTLPRGEWPAFAKNRAGDHTALYRYALEHGDDLKYIPCYCGCGGIGHTSNRACYIKREHPDGRLTFTSHAAA